MQVRAAIWTEGHKSPLIEQVELDSPRHDEVLVRVVATGICHTDLMDAPFWTRPYVTGHEGSGIVEAIGAGVTSVAVGDRVGMTFGSCGNCPPCSHDEPAYCDRALDINFGMRRPDGSPSIFYADGRPIGSNFFQQSSFATHALAQARNVVRLPDAMPLELAGPLGCGIQTGVGSITRTMAVEEGANLVVFGAGSVGLSAVMGGKLVRAGRIVAVDTVDSRLALAEELGATHCIRSGPGVDLQAELLKIVPRGFDYSLETTAAMPCFEAALSALAMQGTCGVVTIPNAGQPSMINLMPILAGGRRLVGILEGSSVPHVFIPELCAHYLAGRLPFDRMVTFYPFAEIGQAIADSLSGKTIKPILRMDG